MNDPQHPAYCEYCGSPPAVDEALCTQCLPQSDPETPETGTL